MATAFAAQEGVTSRLLCDPKLVAYRAAELNRSVGRTLFDPRALGRVVGAVAAGHRQTGMAGDAWQQGGELVVAAGGRLVYRYASRFTGDHTPAADLVAAARSAAEAHVRS